MIAAIDDEHVSPVHTLTCEAIHGLECGQTRYLIRKSGTRSTLSSPSTLSVLTPLHHHLDPRHRMQFDLLRAENQHYLRGEPSHPYLRPPRGPRPDHNHRLQPRRQGTDRRLDLGNRPDSSHSRVSTMTESAGSLEADYTPSRAETAGGFDASSGSAVSLFPTIRLGIGKRDNMTYRQRRSINYAAPVTAAANRSSLERKANAQAD